MSYDTAELFERAKPLMARISDLSHADAVLGWDMETYMPPGGAEARGEQSATLRTIVHELTTSDAARLLCEQVRAVGPTLEDTLEGRILASFARDVERSIKLPDTLVSEMARVTARANGSWKKARQEASFSVFRNDLERIIELRRQTADLLGWAGERYDALLDEFEPGITAATITPVFSRLREGIVPLLQEVRSSGKQLGSAALKGHYPAEAQLSLGRQVVQAIGFNFNDGRIDITAHPFCTNFDYRDVRLTTRVYPDDLRACLYGLIHEAGHGMYEQGVSAKLARTAASGGASMGIHESQSLFWEDVVGRSLPFIEWLHPQLQHHFSGGAAALAPRELYAHLNAVEPSFIRVDADEVTYPLHIILRFEIERELIAGTLGVDDIPERWNEGMRSSLGIVPENDALGCLQDVHWSFGGIGYFPSYALGKLYAAMLHDAMRAAMPNFDDMVRSGSFGPILEWLRTAVHQHGRTRTSEQMVQAACGQGLSEQPFLNYIGAKIRSVYA